MILGAMLATWLLATPASVADPEVSACTEGSAAAEAADRAFVDALRADLVAGRLADIAARRGAIEALVLRHADRHRIERCGDVIRVNSGDPDDALFAQADMVGTITKATASKIRVDVTPSYLVLGYAVAAALAGDRGDVADAARWMAVGQSLAPREPIWRLVDPAVARRGRVTAALADEISRNRAR
jgi:hypothetical protein